VEKWIVRYCACAAKMGTYLDGAKPMMRAITLSLVGPIVLSSLGPIYYGHERAPYSKVIIWALACTAIFSWWARASFKPVFNDGDALWFKSALAGAIMAVIAIGFIAGNSFAYLLARSISD
jgi:hypothetical protein